MVQQCVIVVCVCTHPVHHCSLHSGVEDPVAAVDSTQQAHVHQIGHHKVLPASGTHTARGLVVDQFLLHCIYTSPIIITVEPPIKDAPNKGHLRIKDTIQSTKKSLSYSASTFLTSE